MDKVVDIAKEPVSAKLRSWFGPVLSHGSQWCASNLLTQFAFLTVDGLEFPLTINDSEWDNSWVCSPYTHYISYALEEISRVTPAGVSLPVSHLLRALGKWFRSAELNRVVVVNNWLMSTNPWPAWNAESLASVIHALQEEWPSHALVFRSLNERESGPLLQALQKAKANRIPSRQVWWFDPKSPAVRQSRDLRKDTNLLKRGDLVRLENEDFDESYFAQVRALYEDLYIRKYSRHNPCYTEQWLRHLWAAGHLRFTGIKEPSGSSRMAGVEACGLVNDVMVSPVVGYDTSLPQSLGLYRRLAAVPVLTARECGVPLNLSAGVGRFKRLRGGEAVMEYLAVIDSHLPANRRFPWRFIEILSRGLLAPAVQGLRL